MTDVLFFAGPVWLKPQFKTVNWMGSDVQLIPIQGSGSSHFASIGRSLRDGNGEIIPNLLAKYAPGINPDRIGLAAYSAGHGLLNEIGKNESDRRKVSAVIQSDAVYIGHANASAGNLPEGLVNWAVDGAKGRLLSVVTTSHAGGATYHPGDVSERMVWNKAASISGDRPKSIAPPQGTPGGTWNKLGDHAYWGDIPDLSHGQHHDAAPQVWQALLAPYWAGKMDVGIKRFVPTVVTNTVGRTPWWATTLFALGFGALGFAVWKSRKS